MQGRFGRGGATAPSVGLRRPRGRRPAPRRSGRRPRSRPEARAATPLAAPPRSRGSPPGGPCRRSRSSRRRSRGSALPPPRAPRGIARATTLFDALLLMLAGLEASQADPASSAWRARRRPEPRGEPGPPGSQERDERRHERREHGEAIGRWTTAGWSGSGEHGVDLECGAGARSTSASSFQSARAWSKRSSATSSGLPRASSGSSTVTRASSPAPIASAREGTTSTRRVPPGQRTSRASWRRPNWPVGSAWGSPFATEASSVPPFREHEARASIPSWRVVGHREGMPPQLLLALQGHEDEE